MKGYLNKIEEWFVIFDQRTMQDPSAEDGMLPLHPNDVAVSSFSFHNGKEVEFEIIQYDGTIPILNAWNGYAKLVDSYPVSEENKSHSFCETPDKKCTLNYCDENGCINRKRNLVGEPSLPTDENGKPLTYWGGKAKDYTEVQKNKELYYQKQVMNPYSSDSQSYTAYEKGFIEGFEKAKETLYTEEQMKLCWIAAMSNRAGFSDSISYKEFIQSLKQ